MIFFSHASFPLPSIYFYDTVVIFFIILFLFLHNLKMLRFISITKKHHHLIQVRQIASKAIERPHSQAFYDDKITTVKIVLILKVIPKKLITQFNICSLLVKQ
jgi:hypothetical protein